MRILILAQWFYPEPIYKGLSFAKELKRRGHDVYVITGFPNYPSGKIYSGYKVSLYKKETIDGIKVIRVPLFLSHDRNAIKRILNYVSFAFSAAFLGFFLLPKIDVGYVYHVPAPIGFTVWFLRLFRRIPFVYDIQDIWPDSVMQSGMLNAPFIEKILMSLCMLVYKKASHIVVLSKGFKEVLEKRGIDSKYITVIPNWCDEDNIKSLPYNIETAKSFGLHGKFNVMFAGNMGCAQGLDVIHSAATLLADYADVQFVLIGDGVEAPRIKEAISNSNLKNILFIPRQPVGKIAEFLNIADVLLVHLVDDPLFRITIPSKIPAYLRVGKPILMGVKGEAAEIVNKTASGLCFNPEDPVSLSNAVIAMHKMSNESRNNMSNNGMLAYEREMSLNGGVSKTEMILEECARNRINTY